MRKAEAERDALIERAERAETERGALRRQVAELEEIIRAHHLDERDARVRADERGAILADLEERRAAAVAMADDEARKERHRHHAAGRVCGYDLAMGAIRARAREGE